MAAEDRNAEVSTQDEGTEPTTRERSFDAVARGVANGTVSRRKALRLLAVGLVGSVLGSSASVASAAPQPGVSKCKPLAHKCLADIDCCSRFCDKNGNKCACTPDEIACQDPSSGQLRCVAKCANANNPCEVNACNPVTGGCIAAPVSTPDTVVCRAANGPCDVPEFCSTTSTQCPENKFAPAGTVCLEAQGPCAGPSLCSGNSAQCPENPLLPDTTVCREAAGPCDVPEFCTGTSNRCPENEFLPAGTLCREAQGPCEGIATCTGNGAQCPDNPLLAAGTVCREAAGPCDVAEVCTGTSNQCPENAFAPAGTPCRDAQGQCEGVATCTGNGAQCPDNPFLDTGTPCETGNQCTADFCQEGVCKQGPQSVTCPQCQICDPENGMCKPNPAANGTPCEDGDLCTVGDTCQNGTCQPGAAKTCPDTGNQCTVSVCNPSTGTCQVQNRTGSCDDGNPCTTNDRCQSGTCAGDLIAGCVTCTTASTCPTPSNQCQQATCVRGVCGVENKPNGTGCNDNLACTQNDQCQNGICVGTSTCTGNRICCAVGTAGQGECRRGTGTNCSTGNQCCSGRCVGGLCAA